MACLAYNVEVAKWTPLDTLSNLYSPSAQVQEPQGDARGHGGVSLAEVEGKHEAAASSSGAPHRGPLPARLAFPFCYVEGESSHEDVRVDALGQ